jgi:hypothetical protein
MCGPNGAAASNWRPGQLATSKGRDNSALGDSYSLTPIKIDEEKSEGWGNGEGHCEEMATTSCGSMMLTIVGRVGPALCRDINAR